MIKSLIRTLIITFCTKMFKINFKRFLDTFFDILNIKPHNNILLIVMVLIMLSACRYFSLTMEYFFFIYVHIILTFIIVHFIFYNPKPHRNKKRLIQKSYTPYLIKIIPSFYIVYCFVISPLIEGVCRVTLFLHLKFYCYSWFYTPCFRELNYVYHMGCVLKSLSIAHQSTLEFYIISEADTFFFFKYNFWNLVLKAVFYLFAACLYTLKFLFIYNIFFCSWFFFLEKILIKYYPSTMNKYKTYGYYHTPCLYSYSIFFFSFGIFGILYLPG